jgi:hypothetical protein
LHPHGVSDLTARSVHGSRLKALDEVVGLVAAASEAGRGARQHFAVPGALREVVERYGPGGSRRASLEYAFGAVEGLRNQIRRIESGDAA